MTAASRLAAFAVTSDIPDEARAVARAALQDTVGVILAGAVEPAARITQRVARVDGGPGPCHILGTSDQTGPSYAALSNGTAAHALDFDDMCWTTLAHPSAPLVAAGLAVAEIVDVSGVAFLDAYVVGFEIEAILGTTMNPSHYESGWHCTSTIGTIGATATAARVLGLDSEQTARAIAIAASEASGIKENFGTMVKPLQGGLAARNGVLAALLAKESFSASMGALDGPQGFFVAMQSANKELSRHVDKLGLSWEILENGITVKLYPSCAATHPTIDTLIDLKAREKLSTEVIDAVEVDVDPVTPTVLIYDRPTTGLEGKFSLQYCAAAALTFGRVGIDTFESDQMQDSEVQRLVSCVTMQADPALGSDAPPLTQARIRVRLKDGRVFERFATGAKGYPENPASSSDLDDKFLKCARRAIGQKEAVEALHCLRGISDTSSVRSLTATLVPFAPQPAP